FPCARAHRDLHSFPTRRSSDLDAVAEGVNAARVDALVLGEPADGGAGVIDFAVEQLEMAGVVVLAAPAGQQHRVAGLQERLAQVDRKSTRLNSSHRTSSYAVFC